MNTTFNPLVSIVIPVFNGANYLSQAIDSALSQTYKNIEILVINDGSTDDTANIVKKYKDKIRYFEKPNGGVATALNLGIKNMKGEYFSWLSHDDMYTPNKIEHQIDILSKLDDKNTIIYGGFKIIDDKTDLIKEVEHSKNHSLDLLNNNLYPFFSELLSGCTLLINKRLFDVYGLFDEKLITTQDYDMWFRLLRKNSIFYDGKCNTYVRKHINQGCNTIDSHASNCNIFWYTIFKNITLNEMINTYFSPSYFLLHFYLIFSNFFYYTSALVAISERAKKIYSENILHGNENDILKLIILCENNRKSNIDLISKYCKINKKKNYIKLFRKKIKNILNIGK